MSEEAGEYKTRPQRIRTGQMIPPKEQSPLLTGTPSQDQELVKHQAEAWCLVLTDLVCNYGLDYKEPGKVAADQVRSFIKRKLNSLNFYKRRCDELQRIQSKMRDPERQMVCEILANGTTHVKEAQ